MRVKDILNDYIVHKSNEFDSLAPDISIILPTRERADCGMLERSIDSVLAQSHRNFELIIIDDTSEDRTADVIHGFMERDRRIASIRLARHVGIPAVSFNLGIELSRGDMILCAYDDSVLLPNALTALSECLASGSHGACFGKTKVIAPDAIHWFGEQHYDPQAIRYASTIAQSALLMKKSVLRDIGLFDSHVALHRYFEHDMQFRLGKYSVARVNAHINTERRRKRIPYPSTGMKLEYYPLFIEWQNTYRTSELQFDAWRDREIVVPPEYISYSGQLRIAEILERFCPHLGRFTPISKPNIQGYLLVLGDHSVSGDLGFAALPNRVVINLHHFLFMCYSKEFLAGARVVVVNRSIDKYITQLAKLLHGARIPYYFFIDDYLVSKDYGRVMPKDSDAAQEMANYYISESARDFLRNATAILSSTEALAEEMCQYNPRSILLSCTTPYVCEKEYRRDTEHFRLKDGQAIRIGFFSSLQKLDSFCQLKPLFVHIHKTTGRRVTLFIPCLEANHAKLEDLFADADGVNLELVGREPSYIRFIQKATSAKLHFAIHGYNEEHVSKTSFYKFKTFNIFLTAHLCSVIPLIPIREPFDALRNEELGLADLIVDTDFEMAERMLQIINRPERADSLLNSLEKFCNDRYPLTRNQKVLSELLNKHKAMYRKIMMLDFSTLPEPRLMYPTLPQKLAPRDEYAPYAAILEAGTDRRFILFHCRHIGHFLHNELVCTNLSEYNVVILIESITDDELNALAAQYKNQEHLYFCRDTALLMYHIAHMALVITPFIVPSAATVSFLPFIARAHGMGIHVLGIQHGLFQLGVNQYDVAEIRVLSANPQRNILPYSLCCNEMLNWVDKETGIGYPRDIYTCFGEEKQDAILILTNLNWNIYTDEERHNFIDMILALTRLYPREKFVWRMHPVERSAGEYTALRDAVDAAEANGDLIAEHPLKAYSTEKAIAAAKMVISMPSTVLLDVEVHGVPALLYRCEGNRRLVDALKKRMTFSVSWELRAAFAAVLATPKMGELTTGMYQKFNAVKLREIVDRHIARQPFKGVEAAEEIITYIQGVKAPPANSTKDIEHKILPIASSGGAAREFMQAFPLQLLHSDFVIKLRLKWWKFLLKRQTLLLFYLGNTPNYWESDVVGHDKYKYVTVCVRIQQPQKISVEWIQNGTILEKQTLDAKYSGTLSISLPSQRDHEVPVRLRLCGNGREANIGLVVIQNWKGVINVLYMLA